MKRDIKVYISDILESIEKLKIIQRGFQKKNFMKIL